MEKPDGAALVARIHARLANPNACPECDYTHPVASMVKHHLLAAHPYLVEQ